MASMPPDDRPEPAHLGTEMETLGQFLDFQRATVLWKCGGVSEADLRREQVPSGTNMLSIVKHLAWIERHWFREEFVGDPDVGIPWTEEDPDADLRIEPGETPEVIFALYRRACDESRRAIVDNSPDDLAAGPGGPRTLRWILIHMIEETARHNGHLDILREQTDGLTGE
ncbi:MAG: DinB family protein [Actinomycetota bacterium]